MVKVPRNMASGAERGSRGGQRHAPAALPSGNDLVPFVQRAEWAPGPVWTPVENLAPTRIRTRTVYPVASRYAELPRAPITADHSK
jgi:hypothetical protein